MKERVVLLDSDAVTSKVMTLVLSEAGLDAVVVPLHLNSCSEIAQSHPDLTVIEVELNGAAGLEVCRELRSKGYTGPVIFTSTKSDIELKLEAFRIGADDYIVKPFDPLEFVARVQSVLRRAKSSDQSSYAAVLRAGDAELHIGKLTYKSSTISPTVLTPTEMQILECLMRNHDITISRTTLIERVWGYDFLGDTNRIDVYIRRIRRKIETDPAYPQYLHTVRGLGYVFRAKGPDRRTNAEIETSPDSPVQ
jgi:two-component system, OmpR family, response regulator RegX3